MFLNNGLSGVWRAKFASTWLGETRILEIKTQNEIGKIWKAEKLSKFKGKSFKEFETRNFSHSFMQLLKHILDWRRLLILLADDEKNLYFPNLFCKIANGTKQTKNTILET